MAYRLSNIVLENLSDSEWLIKFWFVDDYHQLVFYKGITAKGVIQQLIGLISRLLQFNME